MFCIALASLTLAVIGIVVSTASAERRVMVHARFVTLVWLDKPSKLCTVSFGIDYGNASGAVSYDISFVQLNTRGVPTPRQEMANTIPIPAYDKQLVYAKPSAAKKDHYRSLYGSSFSPVGGKCVYGGYPEAGSFTKLSALAVLR